MKTVTMLLPEFICNINEINTSLNKDHNAEMQKFKEKMVKFFLRTSLSRDAFNTTKEALSSIHWVTSGNREKKRTF